MSRQLSRAVRELRLQFCPTTPSGAGMRAFVRANYVPLKKANPALPILVRESEGADARIVARFDFGEERAAVVAGLEEKEVAARLAALLKEGDSLPAVGDQVPLK